ncbi:unnamed protein product [Sympodiomycopsis kandeliae]
MTTSIGIGGSSRRLLAPLRSLSRTSSSSHVIPRRALSTTARRRNASAALGTPAFPCLDANDARTQRLLAQTGPSLSLEEERDPSSSSSSGPEPTYTFVTSGFKTFHHPSPLYLDYGGFLPEFNVAYETWGTLNASRDNAILIHTGLSASSHAKSHPENTARGWWEDFIGPGKPLDTEKYFVICTNVLGSCYGSTGPSSPHPLDSDGTPYGTRFPILSIFDMVRAQFLLLDHLGIQSLYASIGSSMGGMQSIAAAHLEPERVQRVVSISGCARSGPSSIALRFAQRSVLMSDPNWNRGHYYGQGKLPPHTGMKLARQIATITYRSGPEWEQRFGRKRRRAQAHATTSADTISSQSPLALEAAPALCPDFEIESYIDYQGEQFCLKYDANSLIYISKAMDLFDMSAEALEDLDQRRTKAHGDESQSGIKPLSPLHRLTTADETASTSGKPRRHIKTLSSPSAHEYLPSLSKGLSRLSNKPTLVIGCQSDILFPIDQQRELAECLRMAGNSFVRYSELDAPTGHDTFLIDVNNVGGQIRGFLA